MKLYRDYLSPLAKDLKKVILDILFPLTCIGCGMEGFLLCGGCKARLKTSEKQVCIACGKHSPFGNTHAGCRTPYGPDGLVSLFDYHDSLVSKAIIHGKYYFLPEMFRILGRMAADKALTAFPMPIKDTDALAPIPLSKTRQRWRGFNQAEILCQSLSEASGLQIWHPLKRSRPTKTQKDLGKEQRGKNVAGCFELNGHPELEGKNIILVDDVVTTGSTLSEAVKILKRNGAARVWCLAIARD